jgi:electron transfer flavoprotein alpha subunit
MPKVWVFAEHRRGRPDTTAFELLTKARQLGQAEAVVVGAGAPEAAGPLARYGADTVYVDDNPVYDEWVGDPAAETLRRLLTEHRPDAILFATLPDSREIAGRLATRLGLTLISNAVDIRSVGAVRTTMFGGSLYVDCRIDDRPALILVRPHSFPAEPAPGQGRVVPVRVELPDGLRLVRRVEACENAARGPDLAGAAVVVAGGRGLGSRENFELLYELAVLLGNAAVGATRAVVEAGWAPPAAQVGLTGTTVRPRVYLAFGISGASQHVAGMRQSQTIIAVNTDPKAPIFKIADLGILGDARKVLPQLIEALRARHPGRREG